MLGWRASGMLLVVLVACGETSHRDAPAAVGGGVTGGSVTGGTATGGRATGGSTTGDSASGGATMNPEPVAGTGGALSGAGSWGAGSGGDDSGGGPCAGIEPRCEPGEQACDPLLGKLGTCDACGVVTNVDKGGVDCVRLLASDKESNGVCAVLGRNRLECFPEAFELQKATLPPDIIEVLLPDDYASGAPQQLCFHDVSNGYSCGPKACEGRVVIGDTGMCSLCSGKVTCHDLIAEPPAVAQPIDISLTDGYAFVLSPAGVHSYAEAPLPAGWLGAPAHLVVDHQSGGCVISDQQELACWLALGEGLQPASWRGKFKKVIGSTLPRACALDDARQLRCGNVFEDVTPTAYGDADTIDFVASASIVCALSVAGHVKCWNDATGEPRNVAPGW